jgi:lipopolysaccharide transport system permease protein
VNLRTGEEARAPRNGEGLAENLQVENEAGTGSAVPARLVVIEPRSTLRRLGLPDVWEYRHLLWYLVLRAIRARYRPTLLGRGWILLRPLLLCLVYVLVFGVLFKVRTEAVPLPLFVFSGVIVFLFFSGGVMDTAGSLINNYGIMSKVYYPRLIVPLTSIIVNLVDLVATLTIVVAMMLFYRLVPDWNVLWAPFALLGIVLTTLGVGVIMAALSVRVKDVMLVLPVVMRVLIYTMPCVYPVSMVPERYRFLYFLNPLAAYLQGFRWALLKDQPPPLWSIGSAAVLVSCALVFGLYYFNRVERTMVDLL